jgi:tRNA(Ile)-lysidine synthase
MNGRVIRPVLGWRRAELAAVVAQAGEAAVDDPSNADIRYDRVRIRAALASADWIAPQALARSAALLAEAQTALEWASDHLIPDRLTLGSVSASLDPALLPRELRRRLVLRALAHVDPEIAPRGSALIALVEALGQGETRTLGEVLCKGGARWRFTRATPRQKIIARS